MARRRPTGLRTPDGSALTCQHIDTNIDTCPSCTAPLGPLGLVLSLPPPLKPLPPVFAPCSLLGHFAHSSPPLPLYDFDVINLKNTMLRSSTFRRSSRLSLRHFMHWAREHNNVNPGDAGSSRRCMALGERLTARSSVTFNTNWPSAVRYLMLYRVCNMRHVSGHKCIHRVGHMTVSERRGNAEDERGRAGLT